MKVRRIIKKALLLSVLYLMVNSFSCKSRGYSVKNCTNDTLFFEISEFDTLEGYTYMDEHVFDSIRIAPEDTMVVYIAGRKTILSNYSYTLPDSTSGAVLPLGGIDGCYLYAIKRQVAINHPLLRNLNQDLRSTRIPLNNWRTADPGHFHYKWKIDNNDTWHWHR